jgi:hypothetical protein
MGRISEAANCFVVIRNNQIRLISRNQDLAEIVAKYRRPQVLSFSLEHSHPIRRLIASYEQNVPYTNSRKLETQTQQAILEVNKYGADVEVDPLSQVESEVEAFLSSYYEIQRRPRVTVDLAGIYTHQVGDRVQIFEDHIEIRAVLTVDSLAFNFDKNTTKLSGFAIVQHVQET